MSTVRYKQYLIQSPFPSSSSRFWTGRSLTTMALLYGRLLVLSNFDEKDPWQGCSNISAPRWTSPAELCGKERVSRRTAWTVTTLNAYDENFAQASKAILKNSELGAETPPRMLTAEEIVAHPGTW